MAVTKIKPVKSTLSKALDYIENPDKTDGKMLISSFGCSYETADIEFGYTLSQALDKGNNLAFHLIQSFAPGEVDRIYLNFSDPWPKDRHAKRRLESRQFLARYDRILKKDGRIEFKTDNRELFAFALEELEAAGWSADAVTWDLHRDPVLNEGNVMTEYEERFSALGNPICKYIIRR